MTELGNVVTRQCLFEWVECEQLMERDEEEIRKVTKQKRKHKVPLNHPKVKVNSCIMGNIIHHGQSVCLTKHWASRKFQLHEQMTALTV